MKRMSNLFSFALVFLLSTVLLMPLSAQQKKAPGVAKKVVELTKKDRRDTIKKVTEMLKRDYVFPEQAIKISAHLKKQVKKGFFKKFKDPKTFSKALTKEMWSVFEDRHMRVRVKRPRRRMVKV